MLPARMAAAPASIDARFGAGFAAQLVDAPVGRWSGPYEGTFGYHVVWREAATAPTSEEREAAEARVSRDWAHDQRERDLRAAVDALVARRRIVVREVAR